MDTYAVTSMRGWDMKYVANLYKMDQNRALDKTIRATWLIFACWDCEVGVFLRSYTREVNDNVL